jgi:hypothetical protein
LAYLYPSDHPKVVTPLVECGSGSFSYIGLQEFGGALIELKGFARRLFWGERFTVACQLGVSFDRGEGDPEGTGGLALVHASLESLYYLGSKVFGIRFHKPMIRL